MPTVYSAGAPVVLQQPARRDERVGIVDAHQVLRPAGRGDRRRRHRPRRSARRSRTRCRSCARAGSPCRSRRRPRTAASITALPVTVRSAPPVPTGSWVVIAPAGAWADDDVTADGGPGQLRHDGRRVGERRRGQEAVVVGGVDRDRRRRGHVDRPDDLDPLGGVGRADRDPDLHGDVVLARLQEPDRVAERGQVGRQLDARGARRRLDDRARG